MDRIVFDVPRWHTYLHRSERGMAPAAAHDNRQLRVQDELFDRLYAGESVPSMHPNPSAKWAEAFHATCDNLPDFQRLASSVRADANAAATAVDALVRAPALSGFMTKDTPPADKDAQNALRKAIRAGCDHAVRVVEEAQETWDGFACVGWSMHDGQVMDATHPEVKHALGGLLKNDSRLKKIAKLAGRFKRIAERKQRAKVKHGADEVQDVEQGADLGRLLPAELARLNGKPVQRLAFLRDLMERQCLQYRMSGTEPRGKGPIVVCLDKSGSMQGAPDVWASAVALALCEIARAQGRAFALLTFTERVTYRVVVKPGDPLPSPALMVGCHGGTNLGGVVRAALDVVQEAGTGMKKADVILVTDGEAHAGEAQALRQRAKGLNVNVIGVGIGVERGALAPWCDVSESVSSLETVDERTAEALFTM